MPPRKNPQDETGTIPDLSVVIPVFNESLSVEPFLKDWVSYLEGSGTEFELIVVNDGSRDGTARILDNIRKTLPGLRVVHQLNGGHSQAIRRGYEIAKGRYVLQVDAGGAYEPSDFPRFWERRRNHSLILGYRTHRLDSPIRRLLAYCLRRVLHYLFGVSCQDPNVPFRLFRGEILRTFLPLVPRTSRAVNTLLALHILRDCPQTVLELPVPYRPRPDGRSRIRLMSLVWYSLKVTREVVGIKLREWIPGGHPLPLVDRV